VSLEAFEARFAILDQIPEALFSSVVTHTHGELLTRAEGVLQWREALLQGELPDEKNLCWPDKSLRRVILMRLEALDIVRYCKDERALTDSILETVLEGISSAEDYFSKAGAFDDQLAQRQKMRDRDSVFEDEEGISEHAESGSSQPDGGDPDDASSDGEAGSDPAAAGGGSGMQAKSSADITANIENQMSSEDSREIATASEVIADQSAPPQADADATAALDQSGVGRNLQALNDTFEGQWGELAMSWKALSGVLDELGGFLGRGWDLTRGVLASQGWRDIARYRKLMRDIPELKQLVDVLGRMRGANNGDTAETLVAQFSEPLRRVPENPPRGFSPHAIDTTEGIKLSDDIARMLPVESALLGHPKLNTLWHARRAESMLRCYQLHGVLSEHSPMPEPEEQQTSSQSPENPGHGPIIVCLDSSASMQGKPETIAKAVTLEALRIAAEEKRDCCVITFSGEQQMISWQLDFSRHGYRALLDFLQHSFHGGTDVSSALTAALEKNTEAGWEQADILLVSDGRFPSPESIEPQLKKAKEKTGLRLHGLLIGRWRGDAMTRLCDRLHRFDLWSRPVELG